jgi:uncharacterized protein (TIGR00299 family) protein
MVKVAYLDCPTGIAGDMCLGALIDLGVPLEYLIDQLGRLGIAQEYKLWTETVHRNSQRATKFHVDLVLSATEITHSDAFTTFDHEAHQGHVHSATEGVASNTLGHPHPAHSHSQSHSPHSSPHPHPPVRHLSDIEQLILNAQLPSRAEVWSLAVFRKLAEAEGAVHGVPPEQVHFHEVGATDALVDIIGTCLGLDWLGIDRLYCSALPTGGGSIRAAHGRLPVPTPAVLKLFEMGQVPIYSNGIEKELVTPTGAAIATTLATQFGPPPPMVLHKVGLGAGSHNLSLPNILRLWIGEEKAEGGRQKTKGGRFGVEGWRGGVEGGRSGGLAGNGEGEGGIQDSEVRIQNPTAPIQTPNSKLQTLTPPNPQPLIPNPTTQAIAVLETQIDDLNPQAIAYVLEVLLEAGALDVFTQAIGMKKSRPGVLLTVICQPEDVARCEGILFRETTTLGIRRSLQERQILPRELQSVETAYGPVRVKVAWAEGRDRSPTNVQPEYEDCAQLARSHNHPWREIQRAALESWYRQNGME